MSLPEAVHRLTAKAAGTLGLIDRGTLRAGAYADLNVFDPTRLEVGYPTYVNDFPDGAGRLLVRSDRVRGDARRTARSSPSRASTPAPAPAASCATSPGAERPRTPEQLELVA